MAQGNWEADKMLDVYIHDYLLKRNLLSSAKTFMAEGKVSPDPVAIDAPGGFLFEWWSVFWDIFIARTNGKHSEVAAAYMEAQQIRTKEYQPNLLVRHLIHQRPYPSHPSLSGQINSTNSDGILGQSNPNARTAKIEEHLKHPQSMELEATRQFFVNASRMGTLKSPTNLPGLLAHGNQGMVQQQFQANNQMPTNMKSEGNLDIARRSRLVDSSLLYAHGLNQGANDNAFKGWPIHGFDPVHPNMGTQVPKPLISTPNQLQVLAHPPQHILEQGQTQVNIGTGNYGERDPRRYSIFPRGNLSGKEGQPNGTDVAVGSPIQSSSPKAQIQQSSTQQQHDQLQQQLQQNNRKRKQTTSSGAADSSGTGNTGGPSPNSPTSTPSTHTNGDGVPVAGNSQHINSISKNLMMYGADGTGGLASSSNQMDDLEHFGDVASLDDNVESFLSQDDGDARDIFATIKSPGKNNPESSKGFTFTEVDCIRTSNSKVVCCHFSSDGKLLASAGHEKKAVIWNMDTRKTESTPEDHISFITDICFRPNSTHLATSSFDKTVRLWDVMDTSYCLHTYNGHSSHVTSLDFHPKKTDLFCSCDGNGEIRLWTLSQSSCSRVSKGGTVKVRFQPRIGQYLAAATESVVSIFDVETDRQTLSLQGHTKIVHSVCWDANGDYLASVGEDSVKVWSLASGECINELRSSNGNNFHSCVFHPSYRSLLIIGGYQSLELWDMAEKQTMTVPAHEGIIAGLAQSPITGRVASASHDKFVKLWK